LQKGGFYLVKRKKILALLLVAAMMGSLIACGGKGKQDDATPDDETVQTSDTNTKGKRTERKPAGKYRPTLFPRKRLHLLFIASWLIIPENRLAGLAR